MLFFRKPNDSQIREIIASQAALPFSYNSVGSTQKDAPRGFDRDHNRVKLGEGQSCFEKAKRALRRWTMFQMSWVDFCWPDAPIEVNTTIGVLGSQNGLWALNCCRIVYLVDETAPITRFGFAYGTLPVHMERGEERFVVEYNPADNSVWYEILAHSRPRHIAAWLGYPLMRKLQKQFAEDSKRAMQNAVIIQS